MSDTYLGKEFKPLMDLIGEMTGWFDLPKYVQTFITNEQSKGFKYSFDLYSIED